MQQVENPTDEMKELRIISQQESNFQMYSVDGGNLIATPFVKSEHYKSLGDMSFSRFRGETTKEGRENTNSSEHSSNSECSLSRIYTSSETSNNSD